MALGGGAPDARSPEVILEDARTLFAFLSGAEEPAAADIVLAMGGSDLRVADTAARAFFQCRAQWLVCTGGFGKDTEGVLPEPESVLYAERCVRLGVPRDRILVERRSTNSGENFQFAKALLAERGIFPRTGTAACKPYMAKRAWATASWQWPEVRWSTACQSIDLPDYLRQTGDPELVLNLMAGDLQRLRVYAGRFQTPVDVPDPVWAAFERLAADGYDKYVIRDSGTG